MQGATRASGGKLMEILAGVGRGGADADHDYLALVSDYFRRQMLIYENWPQRRFTALGYADEKLFTDQNA
ncbi:MAG: hypothetical protein ACYDCK_07750 [Thermoplasmatota archaeon]